MRKNSQIATILTLAIAAVFLFIVITINMGKVSKKKTVIDNACDSAGLLLASGLGSVGNSLRQELGLYGNDTKKCDTDWGLIAGIGLVIVGVLAAWFGGVSLSLSAAGAAMVTSTAVVSTALGGLMIAQALYAAYTEPGMMREMQAKFQNMTAEQRLLEGTIEYALFTTIDDPTFVPDKFDADRDGLKYPANLDKIPQFNHWYFQRLNSLPRIGALIEEFYNYLFTDPPVFEVKENPETWNADEAYLLANGSWRVAEWLRKDEAGFKVSSTDGLKGLIRKMEHYYYGVTFLDELNYVIGEIEGDTICTGESCTRVRGFQDQIKEIYSLTKDEQIGAFEVWYAQFYNGSGANDWYTRMGEWIVFVNKWIIELQERHVQVLACVNNCWAPGPYECGFGGGECCESHCECWPCGDDGGGGGGGGAALFHTGDVRAHVAWFRSDSGKVLLASNGGGCGECCSCVCDSWCGCNPAGRGCCQLCQSGHCRPSSQCNTPTGGPRNCCDSACNIYKQSCDVGTYSSGGGGPCGSPCTDTYYNCSCSNHTHIEPYIPKLEEFKATIIAFRAKIKDIYERAEAQKKIPWTYRAIYAWKDVVLNEAGQAVSPEQPAHLVYVQLDFPDENKGYKFPQTADEREFLWLEICHYLKGGNISEGNAGDGTGDFYITVARYDEDLAKQGPLSNFWRFKFRRGGGNEAADLALLRAVADRFYSKLNQGESCTLNDLVSIGEYNTLAALADNYGIVAKARVHYGPGWTYKKEELPGEASQRNRDIYIMGRVR